VVFSEQNLYARAKSVSQALHIVDGDVSLASLDGTDVGAV